MPLVQSKPKVGLTVLDITLHNETVIVLDPSVLVKSKSLKHQWYVYEDGRCTCDGFQFRSWCRHLAVAREALELTRTQSPVDIISKMEEEEKESAKKAKAKPRRRTAA